MAHVVSPLASVPVEKGRAHNGTWINRVFQRVSRRPENEALRERLKELSSEQRQFGCRRLHILLTPEGGMGTGRLCRGAWLTLHVSARQRHRSDFIFDLEMAEGPLI